MRTSEQTFETYTKPVDVQPNPESHTVTYRPEIDLGNIALITVRTRTETIEAKKADDDYEVMLNDRFRPETD
ncbi:hypothetical protein D3C87_1448790 [compost metagenome]